MIKTAKQWHRQYIQDSEADIVNYFKQIQLEATKHGMTIALEKMSEQESTTQEAYEEYKRLKAVIETARDNLVDIPK